ncbi:MAG: hypothetical protein J6X22_04275 [Muribaculaceae bacterium]|nr:hypothetical protein [Muribaculaceae bacterium]
MKDCSFCMNIIEIIISLVTCVFTVALYFKGKDILKVINAERRYQWNKKELENLFSILSISSIDSFFDHPDTISDVLWQGIGTVDLNTFQYDGKERTEIEKFITRLFEFGLLNYTQTSTQNWVFQPLNSNEPRDAEKEKNRINELESKARALMPLYKKVKKVLSDYHIDLNEIDDKALDFYYKKKQEL